MKRKVLEAKRLRLTRSTVRVLVVDDLHDIVGGTIKGKYEFFDPDAPTTWQ